MNDYYGFTEEVSKKYGNELYKYFLSVFYTLPLAHIINHSIFIVHGGLCRNVNLTLTDLQNLDRFGDPVPPGIINDLLWSDPMDENGIASSDRAVLNDAITISFGPDVTEKFLKENKLKLLIRSHEMQMAGFSITQGGKCMTVFSAPNYMGKEGNKGAIVKFYFDDDGAIDKNKVIQFDSVQPWETVNDAENDNKSKDEKE